MLFCLVPKGIEIHKKQIHMELTLKGEGFKGHSYIELKFGLHVEF